MRLSSFMIPPLTFAAAAGLSLVVAGFAAMVVYVVISRYLFSSTPRWAEELPRMALVWLTFVGAISGFVHGSHFRAGLLDLVTMPAPLRRGFAVLAWLASFVFLAVFIWPGWKLTKDLRLFNRSSWPSIIRSARP